jgi:carboxybiotin decarboxylase
LGLTVAFTLKAEKFIQVETIKILFLGLFAFVVNTGGGVIFAKILNLFLKTKINPMIGATGISAFPMSARVIQKMALKEDSENFLLMHAVSANVSGQIASVAASGLVLSLIMRHLSQ